MSSRRGSKVMLCSGGKDSVLAFHLAFGQRNDVAGIVTMLPEDEESMLYHTFNVEWVEKIAESMNMPWFGVQAAKNNELNALEGVLSRIGADILVSGGISSNYQKTRFDRVARKVGMTHIAPLWGWRSHEVFTKMLQLRMDVVVVGVAAYGLSEDWLGVHLGEVNVARLLTLAEKHRFDSTGEGGDLDTFVLDAPLYRSRLVVSRSSKKWRGDRGMLEIQELLLEEKRLEGCSRS